MQNKTCAELVALTRDWGDTKAFGDPAQSGTVRDRTKRHLRTATSLSHPHHPLHLQGWRYERVADALELPIGTLKSLLYRARKKLKPTLESYHQTLEKSQEHQNNAT